MPKVSVIIPTFNRSDLLRGAIASVRAQTFKDWEIIVVDDGSEDDTKDVVTSLQELDVRIHYIYQHNAGQGAARNRGVEEARGKYIAFLDSDDIYLPENLEKKVDILDTNIDTLIVNGPSWIVEYGTDKFIDSAAYAPTNWVVRRRFLEAGGGFVPAQRNVEDMALRIRAIGAFDNPAIEYFLKEPLTIYFIHKDQATRKPNEAPDIFAKRLETLIGDLYPQKKNSYTKFAPQIFAHLANFYILSGNITDGRRYFRKSLRVRFNFFALLFYLASYGGNTIYHAVERFARSMQWNVAHRLRLIVARMKYKKSFLETRRFLSTHYMNKVGSMLLKLNRKEGEINRFDQYLSTGTSLMARIKRLLFALSRYGYKGLYYFTWFYPITKKVKVFWDGYIHVDLPEDIAVLFFGALPGFELPLTRFLIKNLTENSIFYDVGAHVGFYTALTKEIAISGEVHSFEPNPSTFSILKKNSGFPNIFINHVAVCDLIGEREFYADLKKSSGMSSFSPHSHFKRIKVKTTTLDNYTAKHRSPDFIKIDTEGAEEEVISGSLNLLKKSNPTIIVEIWKNGSGKKSSVVDMLGNLGFSLYGINKNGDLELIEDADQAVNLGFDNFVFRR